MEKEKILSVSQVNYQIKNLLNENFEFIVIQGEISNYKPHSSGHRYFTLKDENSQISCTMWRTRTLNFVPKDGMKVIVAGGIDVYPPRGSYQLDVVWMKPSGIGDLHQAFEELKKKLNAKGYFEQIRKRPIPKLPKAIGISTSPTGAAVQDMFKTLERRYPLANIYFRPTIVQGNDAPQDIANAINELNKTKVDIIIIGRGGGSLEDLWAYNTEIVADAIYKSKKPIISAVGHETDFSIADFTADLRASTPTAAAEIASSITVADLKDFLKNSVNNITNIINSEIADKSRIINDIIGKKTVRRIYEKINLYKQKIDLNLSSQEKILNNYIAKNKEKMTALSAHLNSLHPFSPLDRGFALLKCDGKIIEKDDNLNNYPSFEVIRKNDITKVKTIQE